MTNILPGRFGLIIPRDPIGNCEVCGDLPLYSDRDVKTHLASTAHAEQVEHVRALEQARKDRISFYYEDPDPEVTAHMEKVGKRMLKEGRWTVNKNERAGFS